MDMEHVLCVLQNFVCFCPEAFSLIILQIPCKKYSRPLSIYFFCTAYFIFFDPIRHTLAPLFFAFRIPYTAVICEGWLVELVVQLCVFEARGVIGSAL